MVTLVWGGGEGVLGEPPPPPWFFIILKKPCFRLNGVRVVVGPAEAEAGGWGTTGAHETCEVRVAAADG